MGSKELFVNQYLMKDDIEVFNVHDCRIQHFHVDQYDRVAEHDAGSPLYLCNLFTKTQACDDCRSYDNDDNSIVKNSLSILLSKCRKIVCFFSHSTTMTQQLLEEQNCPQEPNLSHF